jgi:hypothetical protein
VWDIAVFGRNILMKVMEYIDAFKVNCFQKKAKENDTVRKQKREVLRAGHRNTQVER